MSDKPLSGLARELLEEEKALDVNPSPERLDNLFERLERTLVLPPAGVVPDSSPGGSGVSSAAAGAGVGVGKSLLLVAVGAIGGSGATVAVMQLRAPPEPVVVYVPVEAPAVPAPRVEPVVVAPPVTAPPQPKKVANAPPAVAESPLRAEQPLLDIARAAILSGRSKAALEAIERHAKLFPQGELAEEREALAVQALAQLGDAPRAASRAAAFRKRYPQSIFLPSVDAASPVVTE